MNTCDWCNEGLTLESYASKLLEGLTFCSKECLNHYWTWQETILGGSK